MRRFYSAEAKKRTKAGGSKGRSRRARNARDRKAAFPSGLLAALNADHIAGHPDELTRILSGWDFDFVPTLPVERSVRLAVDRPIIYRSWKLTPDVRAADAALITELKDIVRFNDGDPAAEEPLHLIPLHVAVLVLRRLAEGEEAIYSNAIRVLNGLARSLRKGEGKPTTPLETAAAGENCFHAIKVLQAFDRVPRETRELLGRCRRAGCRHGNPFLLGLEKRPTACSQACRVAEFRRTRKQVKLKDNSQHARLAPLKHAAK
jgi:hypothetical protein